MSWQDQGRQEHGWFGNGTSPNGGKAPPSARQPLPERLVSLGHTLVAGLPALLRHHAVARLDAADKARL